MQLDWSIIAGTFLRSTLAFRGRVALHILYMGLQSICMYMHAREFSTNNVLRCVDMSVLDIEDCG